MTSLSSVAVTSGNSCVIRTSGVVTPFESFSIFTVLGDGAIIGRHATSSYYYHNILSYSHNKITFSVDKSGFVSSVIEVWERQ